MPLVCCSARTSVVVEFQLQLELPVTVTVYDSTGVNVLSTQTVTGFNNPGKWLVWNYCGNISIKVSNNGACNCVVSGLYWDN